nr:RecName: Full=Metastasis-associated lung adenocarcinoma transcript 1 [Homo sapiens]AAF20277.1 PRO1073 [Homo sapiens]AAF69659.1 PRO2853 [Homo sapiens]
MQIMFSSVVRISGLCLFPNGGMTYNLFCLYLSIHQGAVFSASRPSYCQAGYDSEDVI